VTDLDVVVTEKERKVKPQLSKKNNTYKILLSAYKQSMTIAG